MKSTIKGLTLCAILFSTLASQAGGAGQPYVSIGGGVSLINDVDIKGIDFGFDDVDAKIEMNPGVRVDVAVGYMIARDWAIEVQSGLTWNEVDKITAEYMGDEMSENVDADLFQIPIMANLIYRMPLDSPFKPWIGAGAGGIFSMINGDDVDENDFTFAFQGMAGLDYELNESTSIGLGYKFMVNLDPEFDDVEMDDIYTHAIMAFFRFQF